MLYLILEAKKAIILEGIEKIQTRTVYKKAKVAIAGNAKVYIILNMMCPKVICRLLRAIYLWSHIAYFCPDAFI